MREHWNSFMKLKYTWCISNLIWNYISASLFDGEVKLKPKIISFQHFVNRKEDTGALAYVHIYKQNTSKNKSHIEMWFEVNLPCRMGNCTEFKRKKERRRKGHGDCGLRILKKKNKYVIWLNTKWTGFRVISKLGKLHL